MYGLHGFSALMGLFGSAFIVTMFLTGWPSLVAVLLNYLTRGGVRDTWLDSHWRWQIRTFWWALLWSLLGLLLVLTLVLVFVGWPLLIVTGLWVLYRIGRGWLRLVAARPMPAPRG